jgi:hypothetical protein
MIARDSAILFHATDVVTARSEILAPAPSEFGRGNCVITPAINFRLHTRNHATTTRLMDR